MGIKQKRHRENIASYISSLPSNTTERQFVTLSVEGNISAGKSTFLNGITAHCPDLQDLVHVSSLSASTETCQPASPAAVIKGFLVVRPTVCWILRYELLLQRYLS